LQLGLGLGLAFGGGAAVGQGEPPAAGEDAVSRSELRERAIDLLLKMSDDENAMVRANAIEGLVAVPTRLSGVIPRGLRDPNAGVRSVSAMAIGKAGLCDLAGLCEPLLHDGSAFARISAIYAQSSCGDDGRVQDLASYLLDGETARVRSQAAFVLGEMGNTSASPLLRHAASRRMENATDAERRAMQLQIAEALFKLGDESQRDILVAALFVSRPEDLEGAALAAQILGEMRSRRSEAELVNLLAFRDERGHAMPAEVRLAAGIALAKLGRGDSASVAGEYLDSENPLLRSQAAILLGEAGGRGSLGELRRMLDDPNPLVRVSAGSALLSATGSDGNSGIRR